MIKKTFTSENCLYWIKSKGFINWKLAIYNDKNNEFRLVSSLPDQERKVYDKKECQYFVNMGVITKMD